MGIEQAKLRKESKMPIRDNKDALKKGVFLKMTKKVLLSKEELDMQHDSRNKSFIGRRGSDCNSDIYYEFLTNHQSRETAADIYFSQSKTKQAETNSKKFPQNTVKLKIDRESDTLSIKEEVKNARGNRNSRISNIRAKSTLRDPAPRGKRMLKCENKGENNGEYNKTLNKGKISSIAKLEEALKLSRQKEFFSSTNPIIKEGSNDQYRKCVPLKQYQNEEKLPQFDRISFLPSNVFMEILSFLVDNFRLYITINPSWYYAAVNAFDNHFNAIENKFVCLYSDLLLFKNSYTSSSAMQFCCKGGIRIDRVLKCENLRCTMGLTVKIAYTYKYCNEPKNLYKAEFVFDSIQRAPNCVWLHRNECQVN